jgi:hypothetical protein
MRHEFTNRIDAINWIAENVENEAQFEVLREELYFNYIYTGTFCVNMKLVDFEIVWLDQKI